MCTCDDCDDCARRAALEHDALVRALPNDPAYLCELASALLAGRVSSQFARVAATATGGREFVRRRLRAMRRTVQ